MGYEEAEGLPKGLTDACMRTKFVEVLMPGVILMVFCSVFLKGVNMNDLIHNLSRTVYGLCVVDYKHWTETNGHEDEVTSVTVVGQEDGKFKRITVEHRERFSGPSSTRRTADRIIPHAEYISFARQLPLYDPDPQEELRAKYEQAKARLDRAMPKCPRCRSELVYRRHKLGSFWGCMRFPACHGSLSLDMISQDDIDEVVAAHDEVERLRREFGR